MARLDWFLARRYLSSRKGGKLLSFITWIALGGVIVGVTALIVVIGVMTGMQEDLRSKILDATPHVLVQQQGNTLRLSGWREVLDSVLTVDEVIAAAPFVFGSVVVNRAGYPQPANLYGVLTDTTLAPPTDMEARIMEGTLDLDPTESGLPPILMGSDLAVRMQVFPGDTLTVASFENVEADLIFGMRPAFRQFEVTGTFSTGMYEYDAKNLYTTLEQAQALLGMDEGEASAIGARIRDPDRATEVGDAILATLGFPYYTESWITTNRALFSALKLEKLAMGLILFLIVVVAAFNIVSTLIMVVADRTREIGILKSMGMTEGGILRIFMLQGAWIGIVGTLAGTVLGLVLCWVIDTFEIIRIPPEVYFVDRLPVQLHLADVAAIVAASVVVAFAATIYPSIQAAGLEPVEAIRHE